MQRRHALRDYQWERIKDALPGKAEDPGRTCADNRLLLKLLCGLRGQARPGEICRLSTGNGQMSTKDSCAGQGGVFGR